MKEIKWIYGLKFFLALIVVFRHFVNGFFQALHTGIIADSKIWIAGESLEKIINTTPLYLIINGGFAVYVFWVLSAFLISYQFYTYAENNEKAAMRQKLIRRYIGICGPIAISYIVVYIMMKLGLFFNIQAADITKSLWLTSFYNWVPSIGQLIYSLFIDTFFTSNVPFNPVLWTIAIEFKGSVILILLLELFGKMKHKMVLWGATVIFIIFAFPQQYLCFCIGMLLGWLYSQRVNLTKEAFAIGIFFISIIGGAYPSDFQPVGGGYGVIPPQYVIGAVVRDSRTDIYILMSGLMIYAIINSRKLQRLFEMNWVISFGKLSTEIYMCHFIIQCSFSCILFIWMYKIIGSYVTAALIALLGSLFLIGVISKLLNIFNCKYNIFINKKIKAWID